MASKAETAETVEDYLSGLPDDRRVAIAEVRDTIVANLPDGIVETMAWGMVAYQVPLEVFPDTYNKKPLLYAALASQKNYMAVYLHSIYMNEGQAEWFKDAYIETGKRLDMGKSCVRFKTIDQLPVDLIGQAIARGHPRRIPRLLPRRQGLTHHHKRKVMFPWGRNFSSRIILRGRPATGRVDRLQRLPTSPGATAPQQEAGRCARHPRCRRRRSWQ